MGLLDEAIRQHLELKRRRGADPDEVARQEDEALGPVTGAGAPAAPVEDEPVVEVPFEPAEPEPIVDEPPIPYEPPAAEAEPAAPQPPPVAGDPELDLQSPTVEFSVDDEVEEEPPAAPEPEPEEPEPEPADELEETPEFLQETPEHDRLWFEQKPPRDFDF